MFIRRSWHITDLTETSNSRLLAHAAPLRILTERASVEATCAILLNTSTTSAVRRHPILVFCQGLGRCVPSLTVEQEGWPAFPPIVDLCRRRVVFDSHREVVRSTTLHLLW